MENLSNIQYWENLFKKYFPTLQLIAVENGIANTVDEVKNIVNNNTYNKSYGVMLGQINTRSDVNTYTGFTSIFNVYFIEYNIYSTTQKVINFKCFIEKNGIFYGGDFLTDGNYMTNIEFLIFRFK